MFPQARRALEGIVQWHFALHNKSSGDSLGKYRVTIRNAGSSYTVLVNAERTTTLKEMEEKAVKEVKKRYKRTVPTNVPIEMEFEVVKE
jgi:hypothetical protein